MSELLGVLVVGYNSVVGAPAERVARVLGSLISILSVLDPWCWIAQAVASLVALASFVGAVACRAAAALGYTRFFTSASAVAPGGTSEASLEEAQVKEVFAGRAESTILLADSSKLGRNAVAHGLDWARIDVLVTDLDPADARLDPYRDLTELR